MLTFKKASNLLMESDKEFDTVYKDLCNLGEVGKKELSCGTKSLREREMEGESK